MIGFDTFVLSLYLIAVIGPKGPCLGIKDYGPIGRGEQAYVFALASGETDVLPGREVGRVAEENPQVEGFRRSLLEKIRLLEGDVQAAREKVLKRQKSESYEATKPDKQAIESTAKIVGAIQEAIALMERTGASGVEIEEVTIKVYERRRRKEWVPVSSTPIRIITRENALQALAWAKEDARRASLRREVPPDLRSRHGSELKEYSAVQELVRETKKLSRETMRALEAVADDPNSLKAEIEKWEKEIAESIENAYNGLSKARGFNRFASPVEPIGFFTKAASSDNIRGRRSSRNLVVVTRIFPQSFMPSEEEYSTLKEKYDQLSPTDLRSQVLVFDSNRFKLIVKDKQVLSASAFVDPHTWGGDVIFNSAGRCIIYFKSIPPPKIYIGVGWLWDPKDSTTGLKLQFDESQPVSVPEKRLSR